LAINAAKDSSDLVAKLRARHAISQSAAESETKSKNYKNYGLDLLNGKLHDEVKAGVLEPSMSKVKQLKSAVEACISIMVSTKHSLVKRFLKSRTNLFYTENRYHDQTRPRAKKRDG